MKLWTLVLVVGAAWALPAIASQPQDAPAASTNWTRQAEKARPATVAAEIEEAASEPAAEVPDEAAVEPGEATGTAEPPAPAEAGEGAPSESPPAEAAAADPDPDAADVPAAAPAAPVAARSVELGPLAYDDEGRKGRIHTVVPGDTLWDISEAYLGTPWVWPTIWNDNGGIANPHLIEPGDHIWISSTEMRRLSDDEALAMMAPEVPPAAQEDGELEPPADEGIDGEPATMDSLPVALDQGGLGLGATGEVLRLSGRGMMGFVAAEVIEGATSIIGSVPRSTMLSEGDQVYVGFGRGEAAAGDRYTIFRDPTKVRDPRGRVIGYHVDVVGHIEIQKPDLESSMAVITESKSEINVGDLLMSHQEVPTAVPVKHSPAGLHGRVVFLPVGRTMMGKDDLVYLDRGSIHGLEVGSELEVFEHGYEARDRTSGRDLRTPDLVMARVVVVSVQQETSVAYVVSSEREIEVGDLVRSRVREIAGRP